MVRGSIASPVIKARHAIRHFDALASLVKVWADDQANATRSGEMNTDGTQYVETLEFTEAPDLPLWGLTFADGMHCLRSTLDYLAYQLAITASGSDPPPNADRVEFPIFDSRKAFYRDWRFHRRAKRDGKGSWVPHGAMRLLEAAQPYKRENGPQLALLRDFDNVEKHRLTHPVLMGVHRVNVRSPIALARAGVQRLSSQIRPDGGAVRVVLEGERLVMPDPVDVDISATFEIVVQIRGNPHPLLEVGRDALNEADRVIGVLRPLL